MPTSPATSPLDLAPISRRGTPMSFRMRGLGLDAEGLSALSVAGDNLPEISDGVVEGAFRLV